MAQERWDVVLRVLDGPLVHQGEIVCRGPVVRMGAAPGPGGLAISGIRGLDERHAVVSAYDGGSVSIAPIGSGQVRVGLHEKEVWSDIPPLTGPVFIGPGSTAHLGPPDRGATVVFVDCRRLGVWEQQQVLSAAQSAGSLGDGPIQEIDARRGIPGWFIAGILLVGFATAVAVVIPLVGLWTKDPGALGPVDEGREYYDFVDASVAVDPKLEKGLDQPFHDFVMAPNAAKANWAKLTDGTTLWDGVLVDYVTRSAQLHAQGWRFWRRLEEITDDYAYTTDALRKAGLPEVFAAIPYQESQYRSDRLSPVCAQGPWQLMPETALRMGVEVRDCRLLGSKELWTPDQVVPPAGVRKNAVYVDPDRGTCRIQGCAVDERMDLATSTRASIAMLQEIWGDPELARSGALVQMAILSHNAGYDDSRFDSGHTRPLNIRPAYLRWIERNHVDAAPDFYGQNITCLTEDASDMTCGGALHRETQHYGYNIIAQHILAVCYYASNHGTVPAFQPWRDYVRGDGYCTKLRIPTIEQVTQQGSK